VLNKGADENYRLRLGMGKPLGMGAVKTEPTLHLTNRQNRYQSLFNGEAWHLGQRDDSAIVAEEASQAFEAFIKENHKDAFGGDGRIEQLLALLSWPGPTPNETEYMDLDQFKQRKVLPTPKAVLEGKTQQNPAQSVSSKGERPTQRPVPQSTAAPDRPKRSQGSNLPQPGEVFTGIVFRILHTGTTFIELKKIAQDAGFARITEDQLGTRQYSVGNRAKCEVIEVNKVGDKWVVDCKPASKKKKK
jgi:DNA polymerase III gamma/tau subunit